RAWRARAAATRSSRISGLEGFGDIVNVDDSDKHTADVGTLTPTTLTGLDMPTAAEVQTILARADHGQFVLRSADWAKREVFDVEEPLESIQTKLEKLYDI